jgi:hypothetical protein
MLLIYGAYQGWLARALPAKLAAAELPSDRRAGDYEIVLAFPPESFHVTRLQAIGRVIEVKDRSVFIRAVEPAALRRTARNYWVVDVHAWQGG